MKLHIINQWGIKVMFKLVCYIKRPKYKDWEGAIIEDISDGKRYITNGYYKWDASENRLSTCEVVDSIDIDRFMAKWNKNFFNGKLLLD